MAIIRENLKSTGLELGSLVTHGDAFTLLERPASQPFDYIYIAPPQYKEMWSRALLLIDKQPGWLSEDGWVIVQIHPIEYQSIGEKLPLRQLVEFDQRQYGSTILVFYRKLEVA
jgi:16S rRNA (guanine966-N2)-methyltransferase